MIEEYKSEVDLIKKERDIIWQRHADDLLEHQGSHLHIEQDASVVEENVNKSWSEWQGGLEPRARSHPRWREFILEREEGISAGQQRHEIALSDNSTAKETEHPKSRAAGYSWQKDPVLRNEGKATDEHFGRDPPPPTKSLSCSDQTSLLGPAFIPWEMTVRNDYAQHFVDTYGTVRPGNAVGNPNRSTRFQEYPKLRRLVEAKANLLANISHHPTYLEADLLHSVGVFNTTNSTGADMRNPFHLTDLLPIKFDVVIIDPPLESYEWESVPSGGIDAKQVWSWDQIAALPIPQIVARESFVFLWVGGGTSDGLERGREVLMRWGFRRCEDIVWVQTNRAQADSKYFPSTSSSFANTTQHCLMGIRGTVRRSTDTNFVHCNIDTDVILWDGEQAGPTQRSPDFQNLVDLRKKPAEMMDIAENFCLGTRRLELFGSNRNLRRGWLTIGMDVGPEKDGWQDALRGHNACATSGPSEPVPYVKESYDANFQPDLYGSSLAERGNLVPFSEEIDVLRPKSPRSQRDEVYSKNYSPQQQQMYLSAAGQKPLQPMSVSQLHGGAGLSGLGAGGREVVSKHSGDEVLSGAQAHVLGKQNTGQRATRHTNQRRSGNHSL